MKMKTLASFISSILLVTGLAIGEEQKDISMVKEIADLAKLDMLTKGEAGCDFSLDGATPPVLFGATLNMSKAIMNIGGRDVELDRVGRKKAPFEQLKKGSPISQEYRSGSINVKTKLDVLVPCKDPSQGCEGDTYSLSVSASDGHRNQTLELQGYCAY